MVRNEEFPVEAIAAICRRYQVMRLELFGSATGRPGSSTRTFGPQSDYDFLVEFDPDARPGFLTLGALARELSELLGRRVDLVPRSGLKPLIRDEVLASAEVLFAA